MNTSNQCTEDWIQPHPYRTIYRWMDVEICQKNLDLGLGFCSVSQFVDKEEFTSIFQPAKRRDIMKFLGKQSHKFPGAHSSMEIWGNADRKDIQQSIKEIEQEFNNEKLYADLIRRYYVCCFTKEFSKDFCWSDQSSKPKVCLAINENAFRREHRYKIEEIEYNKCRPKYKATDDLEERVPKIVFSKL